MDDKTLSPDDILQLLEKGKNPIKNGTVDKEDESNRMDVRRIFSWSRNLDFDDDDDEYN